MQSVNVDLLKQAIELQHGGKSEFAQSVRVAKWNGNPSSWDGVVHIFTLAGHPTARRAFAWTSPIAGSAGQRYFAVLQQGRIRTPAEAAKAAAAAIFASTQPPPPRPATPAVLINPLLLEG